VEQPSRGWSGRGTDIKGFEGDKKNKKKKKKKRQEKAEYEERSMCTKENRRGTQRMVLSVIVSPPNKISTLKDQITDNLNPTLRGGVQ